MSFFVEYDRGTESPGRLAAKLEAYGRIGLGSAVRTRSLWRMIQELRGSVDKALTVPMFSVPPTVQKSKKCPQVEGLPVVLSKRHAKIRRDGYRRAP